MLTQVAFETARYCLTIAFSGTPWPQETFGQQGARVIKVHIPWSGTAAEVPLGVMRLFPRDASSRPPVLTTPAKAHWCRCAVFERQQWTDRPRVQARSQPNDYASRADLVRPENWHRRCATLLDAPDP